MDRFRIRRSALRLWFNGCYTRFWVATRRGEKRCVVAVAGGFRPGVLGSILRDLVAEWLLRIKLRGVLRSNCTFGILIR